MDTELKQPNAEPVVEQDTTKPVETAEQALGTKPEAQPEEELKYSDKQLNDILAKQRSKWEKDAEAKVSEAQRLAKMNADEKAKYELQKAQDALTEREAEINRRELLATAKDELVSRGLPLELTDMLNLESADSVQSSMAALEKVFRASVEAEVNKKLKGTPPNKGAAPAPPDAWAQVRGRYKKE